MINTNLLFKAIFFSLHVVFASSLRVVLAFIKEKKKSLTYQIKRRNELITNKYEKFILKTRTVKARTTIENKFKKHREWFFKVTKK
jgi:ABC-type anion transport system duplicated permease subunit